MSVHPVTYMSAMSSSATPRNPLQTTDPYAREHQIFPTLSPEQIKRAIPFGSEETLTLGTVLFERGDREVDFFIILDGFIEIYENSLDQPKVILVHLSQQFTGELDLFNTRTSLYATRPIRSTEASGTFDVMMFALETKCEKVSRVDHSSRTLVLAVACCSVLPPASCASP